MNRWTVTGAMLLAALALVGTGCGGSDEAATDETAATETTMTETLEEPTETDATTAIEETETTTSANLDNLSEKCKELVALADEFGKAFGAAGAAGGENLAGTSEAFEEFADRVPEEIRDDFRVLAAAFTEYADALQDLDLSAGATPDAETIAKLQQLIQGIDQTEVQAASNRISAWSTENCG